MALSEDQCGTGKIGLLPQHRFRPVAAEESLSSRSAPDKSWPTSILKMSSTSAMSLPGHHSAVRQGVRGSGRLREQDGSSTSRDSVSFGLESKNEQCQSESRAAGS
jgi:hypothetical protein